MPSILRTQEGHTPRICARHEAISTRSKCQSVLLWRQINSFIHSFFLSNHTSNLVTVPGSNGVGAGRFTRLSSISPEGRDEKDYSFRIQGGLEGVANVRHIEIRRYKSYCPIHILGHTPLLYMRESHVVVQRYRVYKRNKS